MDELEGYNTDWLKTVRGQSRCVLKPKTTQEVSGIGFSIYLGIMYPSYLKGVRFFKRE